MLSVKIKGFLIKEIIQRKNSLVWTFLTDFLLITFLILLFFGLIIQYFRKIQIPIKQELNDINLVNGGIGSMSKFWGSNPEYECSEEYLSPAQNFNKSFPQYYNPIKLCEIANNPLVAYIDDYRNNDNFALYGLRGYFESTQRKHTCLNSNQKKYEFNYTNFSNNSDLENYINERYDKLEENNNTNLSKVILRDPI